MFAKVAQRAIRRMASKTFLHILNLDLQFHLGKETGGLSRSIDRGVRGINFMMNAMLFHVVPTILEISLVCGIFAYSFGADFALITFGTLGVYSVFTLSITQWRLTLSLFNSTLCVSWF